MSKYKVNNGVSINHASNRDFLKAMMKKALSALTMPPLR